MDVDVFTAAYGCVAMSVSASTCCQGHKGRCLLWPHHHGSKGYVSCAFLTTTMSKREVTRKWLQVVLWPSGIWMCLSWTLRSRKTRNNTRRLKRTWVKATAITSEGNKLSVEEQGSRCYLTELIREHLQKREAGTLQPLLETSGPPTWVSCDSHREKWCELSLMGLPAITSPLPWH